MTPRRVPHLRPLVLLLLAVVLALTGCASSGAAGSSDRDRGDHRGDHRGHDRSFPATIALPDGFEPEGITSGPGLTFYTGSLADGRIYRGNLRTGDGDVLVDGVEGRVAVGMQWEGRRGGRLWVAGGPTGAVTVYDARSGAELGRWEIPGSGFLNDLTVTRKAVYVTDSFVQRLVVIPLGRGGRLPTTEPGSDPARLLPLTGDITYTEGFNANGIRDLRGGRSLVLVQSSTGTLFRVDPRTGVARDIEIRHGGISSGDGLERVGNRLFVVRGGGGDDVVELRLRRHGDRATFVRTLTDADLDVPTTATFAAGRLWAVNGRFTTPPTPTTPYDVVQLKVRR